MTSYNQFDPAKRVAHSSKHTVENGVDTWTIAGGLSYYHGERTDEYWIHVPNGYRVIGAFVPKFLRNWLRPCDPGGQAAIVHNYLCSTGKVRVKGVKRLATRDEINAIFMEAMEKIEIPFVKRHILYYAAVFYRAPTALDRPAGKAA